MALDVNESSRPPEPDDPRKPESPTDLTKPSLFYVLRKTAREFQQDQCTDLAAALTYYAVLSLFPALLVLVSLLGATAWLSGPAVLTFNRELLPVTSAKSVSASRTP